MLRKIGLAGIATGLVLSNQIWIPVSAYTPVNLPPGESDALFTIETLFTAGFLAIAIGVGLLIAATVVKE
ncbi:MAG: hypothetical protein F4Y50_13905 [Dehalococcoidia bacterium]|nr:hypothetical protein [Dehalococcoidia bacterium]